MEGEPIHVAMFRALEEGLSVEDARLAVMAELQRPVRPRYAKALARMYARRLASPDHRAREAIEGREPKGFFAGLTPEQQVAALAYRGPDCFGFHSAAEEEAFGTAPVEYPADVQPPEGM